MSAMVDRDVLMGFISEAKGYLPEISRGLAEFQINPAEFDLLEEPYRFTHTIKGASSMVGLASLSHISFQLEETLEKLSSGQLTLDRDMATLLHEVVAVIDVYLDEAMLGEVNDAPLLATVTRLFRRLYRLPVSEDNAAIKEVLAQFGFTLNEEEVSAPSARETAIHLPVFDSQMPESPAKGDEVPPLLTDFPTPDFPTTGDLTLNEEPNTLPEFQAEASTPEPARAEGGELPSFDSGEALDAPTLPAALLASIVETSTEQAEPAGEARDAAPTEAQTADARKPVLTAQLLTKETGSLETRNVEMTGLEPADLEAFYSQQEQQPEEAEAAEASEVGALARQTQELTTIVGTMVATHTAALDPLSAKTETPAAPFVDEAVDEAVGTAAIEAVDEAAGALTRTEAPEVRPVSVADPADAARSTEAAVSVDEAEEADEVHAVVESGDVEEVAQQQDAVSKSSDVQEAAGVEEPSEVEEFDEVSEVAAPTNEESSRVDEIAAPVIAHAVTDEEVCETAGETAAESAAAESETAGRLTAENSVAAVADESAESAVETVEERELPLSASSVAEQVDFSESIEMPPPDFFAAEPTFAEMSNRFASEVEHPPDVELAQLPDLEAFAAPAIMPAVLSEAATEASEEVEAFAAPNVEEDVEENIAADVEALPAPEAVNPQAVNPEAVNPEAVNDAEAAVGEAVAEPRAPESPVSPVSSTGAISEPPPALLDLPPDIADDLREVFMLEAEDHLKTISLSLAGLTDNPKDRDLLQEVRRSAHSLKGSAAMVGFKSITQLAHRMEDLLDLLYEGDYAVTPDIVTLLFASSDTLEDMTVGNTDIEKLAAIYEEFDKLLGGVGEAPPVAPTAQVEERLPETMTETEGAPLRDDLSLLPTTQLTAVEVQPAADLPAVESFMQSFDHNGANGAGSISASALEATIDAPMEAKMEATIEAKMEALVFDDQIAFSDTFAAVAEEDSLGKEAVDADADANTDEERQRRLVEAISLLQESIAASLESEADAAEETTEDDEEEGVVLEIAPVDGTGETAALPAAARDNRATPAALQAVKKQGQTLRVPLGRLDEMVKLVSELVIARTAFEQRMAEFERLVEELQGSGDRLHRVATKLETQYEASTLGGGHSFLLTAPATGNGALLGNPIASLATFNTHGFDDLEFDRYTEFHLLSREVSETSNDIQTLANESRQLLGDFDSYLTRQGRLYGEVQDKLMRIRMVGLSTLSARLQRAVRNVADRQAKQVRLVIEGEATELDKTVLEEMADPLQHILRNAVDHGIEPPELRQVKGKSAEATVRVRAFNEGTQVVIQIRDDGTGIDPAVLRATAVYKGYVSEPAAAQMSNEELLSLIFLPGFSTAEEVSEISGRGVGMDVVRATVHRLKGSIAVDSAVGEGTTFTIRLPMMLAITRALMVKARGEVFAVPLSFINQIVRVVATELEQLGDEPVLKMGGETYAVHYLADALNLQGQAETSVRRPPLLLMNLDGERVAVCVDELLGGHEIVVKNLGNHLRAVKGISGATVMGDGSVMLILNPAELFTETTRASLRTTGELGNLPLPAEKPVNQTITVLMVDDSPSVRRVVSNVIKGAGWDVLQAKDGLDALDVLHQAKTPPDVVLLDIEMPRMDGYELLKNLRAQPEYRDLPVVMLTSRAGDKHREKAFAYGATDYLVKPYQDETLLALIRQLAAAPVGRRG